MEPVADRIKRMKMRSWRRGTKEMDLILGPYGDAHLGGMDPAQLDIYEELLAQNDQDLLPWVLGQTPAPAFLGQIIAEIAAFARERLQPAK